MVAFGYEKASPNEKLSWIVVLVDDIPAKLTANLAKKVDLTMITVVVYRNK